MNLQTPLRSKLTLKNRATMPAPTREACEHQYFFAVDAVFDVKPARNPHAIRTQSVEGSDQRMLLPTGNMEGLMVVEKMLYCDRGGQSRFLT